MFAAPCVIHVEHVLDASCYVTCSRLEEDAGGCAAGSARTHGSTGDERELIASTGDFFKSTSVFFPPNKAHENLQECRCALLERVFQYVRYQLSPNRSKT